MKVDVNIKMWDDTPFEKYDEVGITEKFLALMFKETFEKLVAENADGNYEYSVDVKVGW